MNEPTNPAAVRKASHAAGMIYLAGFIGLIFCCLWVAAQAASWILDDIVTFVSSTAKWMTGIRYIGVQRVLLLLGVVSVPFGLVGMVLTTSKWIRRLKYVPLLGGHVENPLYDEAYDASLREQSDLARKYAESVQNTEELQAKIKAVVLRTEVDVLQAGRQALELYIIMERLQYALDCEDEKESKQEFLKGLNQLAVAMTRLVGSDDTTCGCCIMMVDQDYDALRTIAGHTLDRKFEEFMFKKGIGFPGEIWQREASDIDHGWSSVCNDVSSDYRFKSPRYSPSFGSAIGVPVLNAQGAVIGVICILSNSKDSFDQKRHVPVLRTFARMASLFLSEFRRRRLPLDALAHCVYWQPKV